jgi:hypothetical protein
VQDRIVERACDLDRSRQPILAAEADVAGGVDGERSVAV